MESSLNYALLGYMRYIVLYSLVAKNYVLQITNLTCKMLNTYCCQSIS